MTAKEYFHDSGELSDLQLRFIDFCLALIVVLAAIVVSAMVAQ